MTQGDSTGHEIARTLYHKAASLPNVAFRSYAAATDLLLADDVCGASFHDAKAMSGIAICARGVLLATGGLGRVFYRQTPAIDHYDPDLTIRGLVQTFARNKVG